MAAPVGSATQQIQTSYQSLVDAVKKRDDIAAVQMLNITAQKLDELNQEQITFAQDEQKIRVQETLATLGQLLDLRKENEGTIRGLSKNLLDLKQDAVNYEKLLSQKADIMKETIDLLTQENIALKARIEANLSK